MKTKYLVSLGVAAIAIAAITFSVRATDKAKGLVVHEWGTFTSLQGGDGNLIPWKPLKTSELPHFVYDWKKKELGLTPYNMLFWSKGDMMTLQRMETPVIYFYSDDKQPQTVDVSVSFPQGVITEWYPNASQIGPSVAISNRVPISAEAKQSVIRWSNLSLYPGSGKSKLLSDLPSDASGSHYFAARETDSDFIAPPTSKMRGGLQPEKFLFYRGAGNFSTPLRATMNSDESIVLSNTGKDTLAHLFILNIKNKTGSFIHVSELRPGEEKAVSINPQTLDAAALNKSIADELAQSLVKSGLYAREAAAMVKTWNDSWFAENGLRVLYILPRAWTDEILPMDLKPAPTELVRVMVGRAEILRPGLERSLAVNFKKAANGDTAASDEARKTLHELGRFAEPAFNRAYAATKPQLADQPKLAALFNDATKRD